jgi:ACR3 family arsenite efflux pump ArsB
MFELEEEYPDPPTRTPDPSNPRSSDRRGDDRVPEPHPPNTRQRLSSVRAHPLHFIDEYHVTGSAVAWLEKFQIPLYLLALAVGVVVGLAAPASAPAFEIAINPVLIVLLYATFLAVPFSAIGVSLRDTNFLLSVVVLNFVLVPIVVFALTRFVASNEAVLVGILLVLLAPCIDYVIVFSGLAGAASERLLAAAPLLMLLQIAFLPLYLWLFVGSEVMEIVDVAPFVEAFVLLIALPLTLAAATQWLARRTRLGTHIMDAMAAAMVPIMMATLAVVVASQADAVRSEASQLIAAVPIFVAFLVVMAVVGLATARVTRQDVPATRALIFSGATRNSLVVLPLALALPPALSLAAVVVVTQTLVELIGMIAYVRIVPRLARAT